MQIQNLKKKWTPNQYLVCPDGYAASAANAAPPSYPVSPSVLSQAWREVIAAEPRTAEISVTEDQLTLHHTQTSKLVGFVDDIFTEVKSDAEGATLYIYSRSRVGISDRGVNGRRIRRWLSQLDQKIAALS